MTNVFHCFFEQSGTFKNEFKKMGRRAYDYDLLNDFYETDFVIDLFQEINKAYDNKSSIFDRINGGGQECVLAFFPCVRFEVQIIMNFKGKAFGVKNWDLIKKMEYDIKLHQELHDLYTLISKFVIVCCKKNIPLIIENPYSTQHYLHRYWALEPLVIDYDRRQTGDYFEKPTQYWFINCEPKNNFIFEATDIKITKKIKDCRTVERSMISKDYANRFIREYILDGGNNE
jgi:hypothetical protein